MSTENDVQGPDGDGRDGVSDGLPLKAEEAEALPTGEPIWGRLGVRTVVGAVLVLALLVAFGLLRGPEYWRF